MKPYVKLKGIMPKWHESEGTMFRRINGWHKDAWSGDAMIKMASKEKYAGKPFFLEGIGISAVAMIVSLHTIRVDAHEAGFTRLAVVNENI